MVWFKVDDSLPFHEKVVKAGNAAIGLWTRAGAWCGQQLTDGFVPDHMVPTMGTAAQAERLVTVGLWERVDGGYQFHQWNEPGRQPTRAEVEKDRAEARERMRRAREEKRKRSADVRANSARTSGEVRSTRPDPTRPDQIGTSVRGDVASVDAPERPPLYADRCKRHGDVAEPSSCGNCADVRKANAARPLALVRDTKRCLVHDLTYTTVCSGCRADEIASETA